jgi:endonuclease YncB( thermonuclease family)
MIRMLREIIRALARLPLLVKFFIGLAIFIEFVTITQWERLTFKKPSAPAASQVTVSPQKPEQRFANFSETPAADKVQAAAIEETLAKRMARLTIEEPIVQPNGSIIGNRQTLYLYGTKPFNSKAVCTRASGDLWACGLHAYTTLRNSIAKKTIVCDPKTILPNGVSAVCHLGTTDIALALVRDGLVEIDDNVDNAEMAKAQAFAKSKKLGIWDR